MRVLGLTVERTKALDLRIKALTAAALSSVTGSRGWWPLIRELTTGGWQRNEDIPVDTALSNPTLYACVTLIARDIAKMRPRVVEIDDDGIKTEIFSPAFSPFLRRPNHFQDRIKFFEWWTTSKLVHGNTYAIKARDGRNVVQASYILDPSRVEPLVAPDGSVFYRLAADPLCRVTDAIVVPAREMFHDVECPLFHPLCGVSPIYAAGWPAIARLNIRRASDKFFSGGSKPGGLLLVPGNISDEDAADMKRYWDDNFSGNNLGKIAVLSGGVTYQQMAMTAEASQLIEQLRMTDEDIAKCFHMPRHKVGIGPDPTFDNIEALNQQYYTDCLQRPLEGLELVLGEGMELTTVPGRSLGVDFDLSDLLRMDSERRMKMATDGVRSAIFSPNEARRLFDLPPVEGGDSPMAQQQMWTLPALAERSDTLNQPALPPAAGPGPATPPTDDAADPAEKALDFASARDLYRKELAGV